MRMVAGGKDEVARRCALPHEKGNGRSGTRLVRQENGSAAGGEHVSDGCSDAVRGEAMVVADDDALARVLAAHDVSSYGLGHNPRVRECEIFRDDAAPAIGPKTSRSHCS